MASQPTIDPIVTWANQAVAEGSTYDKLEAAYNSLSWTISAPQLSMAYTTVGAYKAMKQWLAEQVQEDEEEDFDSWVIGVREQAKQPKNKELRRFLGTNRWERR